MPNTKQGGKRAGAGRKPIGPEARALSKSVTLTAADIAHLLLLDPNISRAVRLLIARDKESPS